jgi:hypothetical protein
VEISEERVKMAVRRGYGMEFFDEIGGFRSKKLERGER